MLNELAIAACLAMGPGQCATCGPGGGGMMLSPGAASGSWSAGSGPGNPYDAVSMGGGGGGDQLYPFDSPEPWLHGWFQEIPAYGGYHTFRPHNYKHVIAQMDVAGRWGISPVMPYSHQWYHPFRQRAGMHPDFGHQQASNDFVSPGMLAAPAIATASSTPAQMANFTPTQSQPEVQPVAAYQRGYTGTPIPGISTPYYQVPAPGTHAPNQEYLDRLEQLQKQLEQQTFQMQVMQEQMRNQPQPLTTLQSWQMPNYAHFSEQQAPAPQGYQPQIYQTPAAAQNAPLPTYQPQGYQEVPVPPTGGLAIQPAYGAAPYAPSNPGALMPNPAPTGVYGGGLVPNANLPYGAGSYQPAVPGAGFVPNGGQLMMPAPATSMVAPGIGYFSQEAATGFASPAGGYQQPNYGGATHANFAYPVPQPSLGAPSNAAPNWATPNGAMPAQSFNPSAVAPSPQGAAPQGASTGFRPFGRFLR